MFLLPFLALTVHLCEQVTNINVTVKLFRQRLLLVNTSERKKKEVGVLERETGAWGTMGRGKKRDVPRVLSFFPLPSLRAFLPGATVGGLCAGGESGATELS